MRLCDTADYARQRRGATTVYNHSVYRDNYYAYVDAGWYQEVDGT